MVTISSFDPADYIDSEAVAQEYLSLARLTGDATLLTSALKDVKAAQKTWASSTQSVDEMPDTSSGLFGALKR